MGLKEKLTELKQTGLSQIESAENLKKVNEIRVKLLGKKGPITEVLRGMKDVIPEERPHVGKMANVVRDQLTQAIESKKEDLEKALLEKKLEAETIDVTLPGTPVKEGEPHIIMKVISQI